MKDIRVPPRHVGWIIPPHEIHHSSNRLRRNIEQVERQSSEESRFSPALLGCARTEGYYKIVKEEKISPLKSSSHPQSTALLPQAIQDINRTTGAQMSRELRSENRRNLAALGDAEFADHFKFSQLKVSVQHATRSLHHQHSPWLAAKEASSLRQIKYSLVGSLRL